MPWWTAAIGAASKVISYFVPSEPRSVRQRKKDAGRLLRAYMDAMDRGDHTMADHHLIQLKLLADNRPDAGRD